MKKMIKRADGSSSPQGLYDNVRKKAAENKLKGVKGKSSKRMKNEMDKIKRESKSKKK